MSEHCHACKQETSSHLPRNVCYECERKGHSDSFSRLGCNKCLVEAYLPNPIVSAMTDLIERDVFKSKLDELEEDSNAWALATFGPPVTSRILSHLKKEVCELIDAPKDPLEYADCLMLLLRAAHSIGISADQLLDYTRQKLEINKRRKWGAPNAEGFSEHIKE